MLDEGIRTAAGASEGERLVDSYQRVRAQTLRLIEGLTAEDCQVQSMPDASPAKWHLAHTSWFFEAFVLAAASYQPFHPQFGYLFNSYYEGEGPRHARSERGLLTRPGLPQVLDYREHVDRAVVGGLQEARFDEEQRSRILLGLNHEQQHQELLVTDVLHALSRNVLGPRLRTSSAPNSGGESSALLKETASEGPSTGFDSFDGGLYSFGADGQRFAYDNETPRHSVFLQPFEMARRAVTNREFLQFVEDGGYETPSLWLSDGWQWKNQTAAESPLYWRRGGRQEVFSVDGWVQLPLEAPVCHVNYYEACAYAQWAHCRLPTEFEWELGAMAAQRSGFNCGQLLESGVWRPTGVAPAFFGDVWEWTSSSYSAYPGFRPAAGAIGEYNGKFMCGQQVLRGGSCVTPGDHIRATYRNFFPAHCQWQFSGLRLAR